MIKPQQSELGRLQERLEDIAKLYLASDIDSQRLAIVTALLEVAHYFEEQDFPAACLLPIIRPALALAERENNSIDMLFSERKRGGRPKSKTGDHIRTAILAVLADAWLKIHSNDGRRQSVLLAEAARNMPGPWFEGVSGAALKSAREIIRREAKSHVAVEFFERFSVFFDKATAAWGGRKAFSLMVRYINEHELSQASGIFKTPSVSPRKNG